MLCINHTNNKAIDTTTTTNNTNDNNNNKRNNVPPWKHVPLDFENGGKRCVRYDRLKQDHASKNIT